MCSAGRLTPYPPTLGWVTRSQKSSRQPVEIYISNRARRRRVKANPARPTLRRASEAGSGIVGWHVPEPKHTLTAAELGTTLLPKNPEIDA